jgi:hypothetical protein
MSEGSWKDRVKLLRAQTPKLLELNRRPPTLVLSFGGSGFLVTYSLGVAMWLLEERKDLLNRTFFAGSGSGVIPAVAMCVKNPPIQKIVDEICGNLFNVADEKKRQEVLRKLLPQYLPKDAFQQVQGRCALTLNLPNRDPEYHKQPSINVLFGHHIASWDDNVDLMECMIAAMACDEKSLPIYRGVKVVRGSTLSMATEIDSYVRHVYVHGLCGYPYSRKHQRHSFFTGKHGFLSNREFHYARQFTTAILPHKNLFGDSKSALMKSFDAGYHDARRFERWEEDPYLYAKPDRSPGGGTEWKSLRQAIFGKMKVDPKRDTGV